ncbi:MAG: protein-L-isoaspartate(D-aspartate) O-methyltransferase [Flavobacteriales bacterium]|nr:MAG: protein-L-isoaspartate(D-aspartate) O-methyltransferase [Flavobacteriales bacterium]
MPRDTYKHQGARRRLVEELRAKGITQGPVLDAIGAVPRHLFIDDTAFEHHAYEDKAFPIGCGQTISQPYTVAFQTALLEIQPGMTVLEVGTGCGYQTAVLSCMGLKVFSIERHRPLYFSTRERLQRLGYRATTVHGDGFKGLPQFAPFDRVIVTCGAPHVPEALVSQVKTGGRMVIPVGQGPDQSMLSISRTADGAMEQREHGAFRFVPMLEDRVK